MQASLNGQRAAKKEEQSQEEAAKRRCFIELNYQSPKKSETGKQNMHFVTKKVTGRFFKCGSPENV